MNNNEAGAFRIGLAMAGAVSAGAYTAGALDFLIEALDAWEAAKARGERVPRHKVSLEAASGASAGAMCAALLTILLPGRFPHVRVGTDYQAQGDTGLPAANRLYQSWVEAIDIAPLLDTGDLDQGRLDSLLNCQVIDDIIRDSLAFAGAAIHRPYVRRPFVARFTLGNLRGVPYKIGFRGLRAHNQEGMVEHADYRGFLLGGEAEDAQGKDWLNGHLQLPECSITDLPAWQALGEGAAASGAFPMFLRPRLIERPAGDYASRHYLESSLISGKLEPIPPAWDPELTKTDPFPYASVDGGVFNNEPFELAHEVIADGPGRHLPRGGEETCAAVLMVDPFMGSSSNGQPPPIADGRLQLPPEQQLAPLAQAWLMQSRFKPADLSLAYDENTYDRYIIAPDNSNSPKDAPYWIASGALGGFLGFFHEDFRKHDYQLGRRNCQQFLREHFTVPEANALIGSGQKDLSAEERHQFRSSDGQLQIIPLVGRLREEETLLAWPAGRFDPAAVMPLVEQRLDAVFHHYSRRIAADVTASGPLQPLVRFALWIGWVVYGRARLSSAVLSALQEAKAKQEL